MDDPFDVLDAWEAWLEPREPEGWWDSIEEQDLRHESEFGRG